MAIGGSSKEYLNKAAKELSAYGVNVFACPGDLADVRVPAMIIQDVVEYFGKLDILINNAGIAAPASFEDTKCRSLGQTYGGECQSAVFALPGSRSIP
ncbi:MAG: SDR family NAD(P)-dependent oxidoreductase [Caldicoprobacterales bacterium]